MFLCGTMVYMNTIKKTLVIIVSLAVIAVIVFLVSVKKAVSPTSEKSLESIITNSTGTTTTNPVPQVTLVTFTDASKAISFSHPTEFFVDGTVVAQTGAWMQNATIRGTRLAEMTIERTYMPKTNFSGATFTVGKSTDKKAVASCLTEAVGNNIAKSEVTINGTTYTKMNYTDAGAGNFYDVTSYRTVKNNVCYAVEYIIHSTNIGNYSPDQGITEFDKAKIQNILEATVNSLTFL